MSETFLVVGLGNPGREYRNTRHNVGFNLVDRMAKRLNARFTRLQSKALVARTILDPQIAGVHDCKVILAKPQTFMNLSGWSVHGLVRFYKLPLTNLLIAHDDIDLPMGTIRIRPDGGSAGQKGIASILDHLNTDDFSRIRIGIGRPSGRTQASDYVLRDFSKTEIIIISETLDRAVEAIFIWMTDGLNTAMNKFNGLSI